MKEVKERKYTTEIVKDYCEEYRDMPSKTLARMILKNHPLDFEKLESVRTLVRRVRNERGVPEISETKHLTRTPKQIQQARQQKDWHDIPETDYEELAPYEIPSGNNRILSLSDVHLPYHDPKAIELTIEYAKKHLNPNVIYLNGDIMDVYQASRFTKDRRLRDLAGELDITRDFLDYINEQFPKAKKYYKIGNHEDRWESYLKSKAPELLGIDEFQLSILLRFGEKGYQLIKSKQFVFAGKLAILHGHEVFAGFGGQVNPARTIFTRAISSTLIGHHHRTSEHTEKDIRGNIISTFSQGCLCGLRPDYMPHNKWNHGFAFIETEKDGGFQLDNLRIVKGKVR
ncbi:metallophosphoesterase [Flagellimonas sp. CMM7]|uniref:metallophosphoesterase n=1 Tax=Flagellimonas sp. CMM7 TaxID=2654676 RepID=UPI0013D819B3|nr:metallophosphoesterase [Flagellimonas sp. CMM7]UII79989.1 metallophosphoesterase [Flagellimonas sp. CMM7]